MKLEYEYNGNKIIFFIAFFILLFIIAIGIYTSGSKYPFLGIISLILLVPLYDLYKYLTKFIYGDESYILLSNKNIIINGYFIRKKIRWYSIADVLHEQTEKSEKLVIKRKHRLNVKLILKNVESPQELIQTTQSLLVEYREFEISNEQRAYKLFSFMRDHLKEALISGFAISCIVVIIAVLFFRLPIALFRMDHINSVTMVYDGNKIFIFYRKLWMGNYIFQRYK